MRLLCVIEATPAAEGALLPVPVTVVLSLIALSRTGIRPACKRIVAASSPPLKHAFLRPPTMCNLNLMSPSVNRDISSLAPPPVSNRMACKNDQRISSGGRLGTFQPGRSHHHAMHPVCFFTHHRSLFGSARTGPITVKETGDSDGACQPFIGVDAFELQNARKKTPVTLVSQK
jgi:hypothetical protein